MNRAQLRAVLDQLDAAERVHRDAMKPHKEALRPIEEARETVLEAFGKGEIVAHCDTCGMPFFDGDQYASDTTGDVTVCLRMANEDNSNDKSLPCYDPDL